MVTPTVQLAPLGAESADLADDRIRLRASISPTSELATLRVRHPREFADGLDDRIRLAVATRVPPDRRPRGGPKPERSRRVCWLCVRPAGALVAESAPLQQRGGRRRCWLLRHGATTRCACTSSGIKPVASTSAAPGGWREADHSDRRYLIAELGITDTPSIVCTYTVREYGSIATGSEELLAWATSVRLAPG
jgi:hypothetical protein